MPHHGQVSSDQDVSGATKAGVRGAIVGAAQWGIFSAVLGGAAYMFSPVYRNLTGQFKIYLQMSGMTIGAIVQGERRIHDYEVRARRMRKLRKNQEVWSRFEQDETDTRGNDKSQSHE